MGKPLSRKARARYAKAMAAKEGRLWLSKEEYIAQQQQHRADLPPPTFPSEAEIAAYVAQHPPRQLRPGSARGALDSTHMRAKFPRKR